MKEKKKRMTGYFPTPKIWVDESHKMITNSLGKDWKKKYVVWDCACGTANLTRGHKFQELYISTIDQSDINTITDCKYNPEATIFKYDFLASMGLENLPEGLKEAFRSGKKILFLINPPYATANVAGTSVGQSKEGVANTSVGTNMKQKKLGSSSRQLYAQFMYKVLCFSEKFDVSLGIFSKPTFMTSCSFIKFRNKWYESFKYRGGMLFQASHFADVKGQWGISFTIWDKKNIDSDNLNDDVAVEIKDITSYDITTLSNKYLYTSMNNSASKWVRNEIKGVKLFDAPQISSYVTVKPDGRGKLAKKSIGYITSSGNNVYNNAQCVFITSSCASTGANKGGFSILSENFRKVVALFAARKTITGKHANWINDKDEYLVPNTEHPDYEQWNNDCIVYSLFNVSSQQSSLRQINYKGKKWDIINNFFFMSNSKLLLLAKKFKFKEMIEDVKKFGKERYVYNILKKTKLSPQAREVLNKAKELIKLSFPKRREFHLKNPEQHLNSWDAGWAQIKKLLKKEYKEEYDDFVLLYKEFEKEMRKGVYKFKFLL